MSKKLTVVGEPIKNFKPDICITIKHQNSNPPQTTMEITDCFGNPCALSPLTIAAVLINALNGNNNMMLQMTVQSAANIPHHFIALEGETKCRAPRCGKDIHDPIHIDAQVSANG